MRPSAPHRLDRWAPWLAFLLALVFYTYTLQPSLAWGDGTRLQREAVTGESFILAEMVQPAIHPDPFPFNRLGVAAWDHPLFVMLAHTLVRLLPWVARLWLVNFVSALGGAGAVALVYALIATQTSSRAAGAVAAASLMVSHTFWFHAVTPEVYTLLAVLLLAGLVAWQRFEATGRRGWLFAAGLVLGLGASNHLLAVLAAPALVIYWALEYRSWPAPRPRLDFRKYAGWLALVGAGFLLGFVPYLVQLVRLLRLLPFDQVMGPVVGTTFLANLLALTPADFLASLVQFVVLHLAQFNPVGLGLGAVGLWRGAQVGGPLARKAAAGYVVYATFGLLYHVSDQFAFYLSAYVFLALAIGLGTAVVLRRLSARRRVWVLAGLAGLIGLMPVAYDAAPRLVRAAGSGDEIMDIPQIGTGVRDGLAYYVNPNKHGDYGAWDFGLATMTALPPNALVLAEWYTDTDEYFVLRYFNAVEGVRTDVVLEGWPTEDPFAFSADLALARVAAEAATRPVYLASLSDFYYGVETLKRDYCVTPEHNLYRVYPRAAAPAGAACLP